MWDGDWVIRMSRVPSWHLLRAWLALSAARLCDAVGGGGGPAALCCLVEMHDICDRHFITYHRALSKG